MSDNDGYWMDHRDELFELVVQRGRARKRRRAIVVTASVLTVLLVVAIGVSRPARRTSVVQVAGSGSDQTPTTVRRSLSKGVLLVGDQVMLGAVPAIEEAIPGARVDAGISRQFDQGATLIERDKQDGVLPQTIVVHLGDNGLIGDRAFDGIMRAVGPDSTVVFVTAKVPRAWETAVNDALYAGARRWPNARVLDWRRYSVSHSDWFTLDGFHLSPVGQTAYAAFIRAGLGGPEPTAGATASTTTTLGSIPMAALSTFLAAHPEVVVHTDPFLYNDTYVALVGIESRQRDRVIGIVSISDGVARQIESLTLPGPNFGFSRSLRIQVADLTGDGAPDVLIRFDAADNRPGVVVSGDGGAWHVVPESSDRTDVYIGRNPTIKHGHLATTHDDCIPNCAEGHSTTLIWHYDRANRILVSR